MALDKIKSIIRSKVPNKRQKELVSVYEKYKGFTMVPEEWYLSNLQLAEKAKDMEGDVVECGVWRGGMIAGIAEILQGNRNYYLYDSFEGLPPAKEIDGSAAREWQKDTTNEYYFDNCKAEIDYAIKAMDLSGVKYKCIKGWFSDTLKDTTPIEKISLLRLDGDWYESTMDCLVALFPKVIENGIIIIDDYYAWAGCSRAVHDYLGSIKSASRIYMTNQGIAYIVKTELKA